LTTALPVCPVADTAVALATVNVPFPTPAIAKLPLFPAFDIPEIVIDMPAKSGGPLVKL